MPSLRAAPPEGLLVGRAGAPRRVRIGVEEKGGGRGCPRETSGVSKEGRHKS
jgi:hypothetical protein